MQNIRKSATQITDDMATTISLIIVNDTSKILNSGTLELAISDHKLVFATLKWHRYNPCPVLKEVHDHKKLEKVNFKGHLNGFPGE